MHTSLLLSHYGHHSPLAKRNTLIKHSKLAAVAFLNELPQTRHVLESFVLDVGMATVSCFIIFKYIVLCNYIHVIQNS